MLFVVVAWMVVDSTIAIINGKDAVRGKFPYFAYLKCYRAKRDWSLKSPVILLNCVKLCFQCMQGILRMKIFASSLKCELTAKIFGIFIEF